MEHTDRFQRGGGSGDWNKFVRHAYMHRPCTQTTNLVKARERGGAGWRGAKERENGGHL